jgi:hypothetical protein
MLLSRFVKRKNAAPMGQRGNATGSKFASVISASTLSTRKAICARVAILLAWDEMERLAIREVPRVVKPRFSLPVVL